MRVCRRFAQTQMADPGGFAAVESVTAGEALLADCRSNPSETLDSQVRLSDVAGAFRRLCG
jgi:hypothetical protein